MAFVPQSTYLIASPRRRSRCICTPRRPRTAAPAPPTATARPLRASTAAAVIPVLATRRQVMSRLGSLSKILDRVFVSLLLLLLLHLFPLFPVHLSSLLRLFLCLGPIALPWARATRENAALRRSGRFLLLSAPLRASRVADDAMRVQLRCEESGLGVEKEVRVGEGVLRGDGVAHALCALKGAKVDVLEVFTEGRSLVGCEGVREHVLKRICGAAERGV